MIEDANCPIKTDCLFYGKDLYSANEMEFYRDYCLKGGMGCGLKRHHDLTELAKERAKKGRLENK